MKRTFVRLALVTAVLLGGLSFLAASPASAEPYVRYCEHKSVTITSDGPRILPGPSTITIDYDVTCVGYDVVGGLFVQDYSGIVRGNVIGTCEAAVFITGNSIGTIALSTVVDQVVLSPIDPDGRNIAAVFVMENMCNQKSVSGALGRAVEVTP